MTDRRITVTLTAEINAVTDALLALEAGAVRLFRPGTPQWNQLAQVVLPLREARDQAIAVEQREVTA